jgi:hypothetical protein
MGAYVALQEVLTDPKRGQYGVPFENLETNKD